MYFMKNLGMNQKRKGSTHDFSWGALSTTTNAQINLVEWHQRIASEVLLAPVDTRRDDPQKLPVEVLLYRQALVGSQNADLVDFTGFQEDRAVVWVIRRNVSDVAIERRVLVFGVPHGATVVEIVGEQNPDITVEGNTVSRLGLGFWTRAWAWAWSRYAPSSTTTSPAVDLTRDYSHFRMQCATILCALPAMRGPRDGDRFVDRQEADVALLQKHRIHDVLVSRVDVGNRRRIALDVRHHQASNTRKLREHHCLSCVCVHCLFLLSRNDLITTEHIAQVVVYYSIITSIRQEVAFSRFLGKFRMKKFLLPFLIKAFLFRQKSHKN